MFKFLKKTKVAKFVTFLLIFVFCFNASGCGKLDENGYNGNKVNREVTTGVGANTIGYTIYAESSFDKLTKEVFMGYLLANKPLSVVVVPGHTSEEDDETVYNFDNENNKLYQSALYGIYKYDDRQGKFIEPEKKVLLYYITDDELRDWFTEFKGDDTALNYAGNFMSKDIDLEDQSRYTCRKLVNMGSGLSADAFCEDILEVGKDTRNESLFNNGLTGGIVLLFGYSSIEGYLTYANIENYQGSSVANGLANCTGTKCFDPNSVRAFNIRQIVDNNSYVREKLSINEDYNDVHYGGYQNVIAKYKAGQLNDEEKALFEQEVAEHYTEEQMLKAKAGYETLATVYRLIGNALLSDTGKNTLSELKTSLDGKESKTDTEQAQLDIVNMLFDFSSTAKEEAFNIKFSGALFSRYTKIVDYPSPDSLVTGESFSSIIGGYEGKLDYSEAKKRVEGKENEDYLMLVTADGFVLDRGTEEQQKVVGAGELANLGLIMSELVRMDACPNATLAAEMYNLIANLKVGIGIALVVAGSAAVIASVGLMVAGVLAKVAGAIAATPIPGARIVTIVLLAVAGLVAIGVGIYSFFKGMEDKSRLKGLGASSTNYCQTYASTFNVLFETLELTIPIYHYRIPEETEKEYNKNLSLRYYKDDGSGEFTDENGRSYDTVEMYYYADVQQSKELKLEGCPMLMYYQNGKLRDYIYGASTPEFIVEALRLWGLLASREMVYRAKVDWNNSIIKVSHTSNQSARTNRIYGAKYCFNLEYGQSLYASEECILSDVKSLSSSYKYYPQQGKEYEYFTTELVDISELNFASLATNSDYISLFADMDSYKLNQYIKSNNITIIEPVTVDVTLKDGDGETSFSIRDVIDNILNGGLKSYEILEGSKGKYYIIYGETENAIYYSEALLIPTSFVKIATFTGNLDTKDFVVYDEFGVRFVNGKVEFRTGNNEALDSYAYETYLDRDTGKYAFVIDGKTYFADEETPTTIIKPRKNSSNNYYDVAYMLDYINNKVTFDDDVIEIPFYFTATIQESSYTQSTSGVNKTCSDDKYLVSRTHTFLGATWTTNKCVTMGDMKSNDDPYESEMNYYSTSVRVGTIYLSLEDQSTDLIVVATYLNKND